MKILIKENVLFVSIFILSVLMFLFFLNQNYNINYYDEVGYLELGDLILENGLFNSPHELRTYLFGLLIAVFKLFSDGTNGHVKIAFSIFQYAFYVFTIWFIAKKSFENSRSKVFFYSILVFGLLNPYLVQSTTLFLTDILSTCLIVISLILLITSDLNKFKSGILISLLIYSAIMIRPSSAAFLLPFFVITSYRFFAIKDFKPFKLILSGIVSLVIFFPQLYNNVTFFNHWTILIHSDLMKSQTEWAVQNLKYGTVIAEGEQPQLYYKTPFIASGTMIELFFSNPLQFIFIYFSHIFGVLDWGVVDNYIRQYTSPSRWVASLFLYSAWFLMFCGIIYQVRRKVFLSVSLLFSALVYILFIGLTAVESRFGFPIYLILLPFVGYGINAVKHWCTKRWLVLTSYILMVILFFYLSYVMDTTTGRIEWF